MSADDRLRVSDAERDQAAALLSEHYAQGRLTQTEHAERLDRVWGARTAGELRRVFTDLPADPAPAVRRPAGRSAATGSRRRRARVFGVLAVVGLLTLLTPVPLVVWIVLAVVLFTRRGGLCGAQRARLAPPHRLGHTPLR